MKPLGSIAALVAAIRDDAAADADNISATAAAAADRLAADGAMCPDASVVDQRALAAARERARSLIAQEDWDDGRAAIAEREEWITRAVELGMRRLAERESNDRRLVLLGALAREAISRLPSGPIEIVVAEADVGLLDRQWCTRLIPDRDPDSIRIIGGSISGGCVARSADGRASFDNSYAARAERLQAAWRAALADVYDRATDRAAPPRAEAS